MRVERSKNFEGLIRESIWNEEEADAQRVISFHSSISHFFFLLFQIYFSSFSRFLHYFSIFPSFLLTFHQLFLFFLSSFLWLLISLSICFSRFQSVSINYFDIESNSLGIGFSRGKSLILHRHHSWYCDITHRFIIWFSILPGWQFLTFFYFYEKNEA